MTKVPSDLRRAVKFHGHLCPGLVIGYRAAKVALERLGAGRAQDEELIAIVENDSCAADAVQALTGCTFGKGNFFFRDWGKHVYTLAVRPSGRAVRVSLRADARRRRAGASRDAAIRRRQGYGGQVRRLLDAPVEELFAVTEPRIRLPHPARIHDSVVCSRCGEPAMSTRIRRRAGKPVCLGCLRASKRRRRLGA